MRSRNVRIIRVDRVEEFVGVLPETAVFPFRTTGDAVEEERIGKRGGTLLPSVDSAQSGHRKWGVAMQQSQFSNRRKCLAFGLVLLTAMCGQGCTMMRAHNSEPARVVLSNIPRELNKLTLPTYRVEPPDILLIEAVNNIRPVDEPLRAGDEIRIQLRNGLPLEIEDVNAELDPLQYQVELEIELQYKVINGLYRIGADGKVDLGPAYGQVAVAGLSLAGARAAIDNHLREYVGLAAPELSVSMPSIAGRQVISGEHLVRPDGTVDLGIYGNVRVAGMTLYEIKLLIESHLAQFMHQPEVRVDVLAYNSKAYYVIMDGGGFGEQVIKLPVTGNETVLDAIAQVEGLSSVSSKRMWIARPAPAGFNQAQVLDVDWSAITAEGITTTNYQLLPGDRIYVQADHLVAFDTLLGKITAPIERVLGVTLLGVGAVQRIDFYSRFNSGSGFSGGGGGGP